MPGNVNGHLDLMKALWCNFGNTIPMETLLGRSMEGGRDGLSVCYMDFLGNAPARHFGNFLRSFCFYCYRVWIEKKITLVFQWYGTYDRNVCLFGGQ